MGTGLLFVSAYGRQESGLTAFRRARPATIRSWRRRAAPNANTMRAPRIIADNSAPARGRRPEKNRKDTSTPCWFCRMKTRIATRARRPTTTAVQAPLRRVPLSPGSGSGSGATSCGGVLSIVLVLVNVQQADADDGHESDPRSDGPRARKPRCHSPVPNRPQTLLQRCRLSQAIQAPGPLLSRIPGVGGISRLEQRPRARWSARPRAWPAAIAWP